MVRCYTVATEHTALFYGATVSVFQAIYIVNALFGVNGRIGTFIAVVQDGEVGELYFPKDKYEFLELEHRDSLFSVNDNVCVTTLKKAERGVQPKSMAASVRETSICCSLGITFRMT